MSMEALKWAREPRGLGGPAAAVLRDLADRANGKGVCWPSVATIAGATGYSTRTVQRALRELEAEKLVETKQTGRSNHFKVCHPRGDRESRWGDTLSPQRCHSDTQSLYKPLEAQAASYRQQDFSLPVGVDEAALQLAHEWLERHAMPA